MNGLSAIVTSAALRRLRLLIAVPSAVDICRRVVALRSFSPAIISLSCAFSRKLIIGVEMACHCMWAAIKRIGDVTDGIGDVTVHASIYLSRLSSFMAARRSGVITVHASIYLSRLSSFMAARRSGVT